MTTVSSTLYMTISTSFVDHDSSDLETLTLVSPAFHGTHKTTGIVRVIKEARQLSQLISYVGVVSPRLLVFYRDFILILYLSVVRFIFSPNSQFFPILRYISILLKLSFLSFFFCVSWSPLIVPKKPDQRSECWSDAVIKTPNSVLTAQPSSPRSPRNASLSCPMCSHEMSL